MDGLSASLQTAQSRKKHGRVETGCSGRDRFNGERIWNDTIWSDRPLSERKCPAGNGKCRGAAVQVKATNARSLMQHPLNCFLVKSLGDLPSAAKWTGSPNIGRLWIDEGDIWRQINDFTSRCVQILPMRRLIVMHKLQHADNTKFKYAY